MNQCQSSNCGGGEEIHLPSDPGLDSHADQYCILDCSIRINTFIKGETQVLIDQKGEKELFLIDPGPISKLIKKYMSDESYEECVAALQSKQKFIEPLVLKNGFSIQFSEDDQVVDVFIPPIFIGLHIESISEKREEIDPEELIFPATFSCYANCYLDATVNPLTNSHFSFRNHHHNLCCDYCLHKELWTLEGDFDCGYEHCHEQLWSRSLLTKDLPEKNLRLGFGNIETPLIGLQKGFGMVGMSVKSRSDYFDAFVGRSNYNIDFFLTKLSKINLFINGMFYKTILLPPGPHRLEDFPCIPGNNAVTLKIDNDIDDLRTLDFTYQYNPSVVKEGICAYSLGIGFPDFWCQPSFAWKIPSLTTSFIYGMTPHLSSGGFFQISPRNLQIGFENIWYAPRFRLKTGSGLFWVFRNYPHIQCHLALDNSVSNNDDCFRWDANCYYLGRPLVYGFDRLSSVDTYGYDLGASQIEATFNLSRRLWDSVFVSGGVSATINQNWRAEYGVSASLSKSYNQFLSASISGYTNFNNRCKNVSGMVFTISTSIPHSSIYNNSSYISETKAFYNQTSWNRTLQGNTSLGASIGLEKQSEQQSLSSAFFLNHDRFIASSISQIRKRADKTPCQQGSYNGDSNLSLGTCFLYADGCYAISRPNYDSFVMIKPNPDIASTGVQVNHQACSSWHFLPAVLGNQASYETLCIDVQANDLPIGYNFGESRFFCQTQYKSGTSIIVGKGQSFLVTGKLLYSDNTPVVHGFGYIKNVLEKDRDDLEPLGFFTNREGEFQIESLQAGDYELQINGKDCVVKFTITPNEEGFIELGSLLFSK